MADNTVRIAMWSGPRNISTALLRSWGSRSDTFVCDEPFYAHYLDKTGIDHPGRQEALESQGRDWRKVVAGLTGEVPGGKNIYYQKHMAHHLLPDIERDWIGGMRNALLIRHPRDMLTSLIKLMPQPTIEDTGLPQQVELYDQLSRDKSLPVVDSRDILEDPEKMLTALCDALEVPFDDAMLSWPAGPRDSDGVWAKYWYDAVEKSTGFAPYRPKTSEVPDRLRPLYEECIEHYKGLHALRLQP